METEDGPSSMEGAPVSVPLSTPPAATSNVEATSSSRRPATKQPGKGRKRRSPSPVTVEKVDEMNRVLKEFSSTVRPRPRGRPTIAPGAGATSPATLAPVINGVRRELYTADIDLAFASDPLPPPMQPVAVTPVVSAGRVGSGRSVAEEAHRVLDSVLSAQRQEEAQLEMQQTVRVLKKRRKELRLQMARLSTQLAAVELACDACLSLDVEGNEGQ